MKNFFHQRIILKYIANILSFGDYLVFFLVISVSTAAFRDLICGFYVVNFSYTF